LIFYDSNYNFIDIGDSCFEKLKFSSPHAMRSAISDDFANLFVEKSGFVYDFSYLSWIEFLLQEKHSKALLKLPDGNLYETRFKVSSNEQGFKIEILKIKEYFESEVVFTNQEEKIELLKIYKKSKKNIFEKLNPEEYFEVVNYFEEFNKIIKSEKLQIYISGIQNELKSQNPDFKKVVFDWMEFASILDKT
jgi:hypothetical protein